MLFFPTLFLSMFITIALIPILRLVAKKMNIVDIPNERKVHDAPMPKVGGIAIALALQNILGDFFSSLAIYFDKPFKVGDFVVLGDQMGTVKKIGIKTTRIQVPQCEELVVANSELVKSQVRNFGIMQRRRNLQNIGVTYDTPAEKLKQIPDMIKQIVTEQNNTEYDRTHFKTFGDSGLIFEVVYYVLTGDYKEFMDLRQKINLNIVEKFNQEKIEFAFPTQTVYVKGDTNGHK